jgi:sirohydrochlorin ferrochelatase
MSTTRSLAPRAPATEAAWAEAALVLLTHGVDGQVGSANDHVARLRARGLFASVDACCLSGVPTIGDAMAAVASRRVYVVPFLMSEGYTARVVLPRQIADLEPGERELVLCRPVGTSDRLLEVVESRVRAACRHAGWKPGDSVLAIVSHGTTRHPQSGAVADDLAASMRRRGRFKRVETGFLAQDPSLAAVIDRCRGTQLVVVGLFADEGSHGRADIEELLTAAGPNAVYGGPIGPAPEMVTAILDRVQEA